MTEVRGKYGVQFFSDVAMVVVAETAMGFHGQLHNVRETMVIVPPATDSFWRLVLSDVLRFQSRPLQNVEAGDLPIKLTAYRGTFVSWRSGFTAGSVSFACSLAATGNDLSAVTGPVTNATASSSSMILS